MTASRCSSNLSDIAGVLCRQISPSCVKNYLAFLFTPLLPPTAKGWLCGFLQRKWDLLKWEHTVGIPKPTHSIITYATDFHSCFSCYLIVLVLWKNTNQPTKKLYAYRNKVLRNAHKVQHWNLVLKQQLKVDCPDLTSLRSDNSSHSFSFFLQSFLKFNFCNLFPFGSQQRYQ